MAHSGAPSSFGWQPKGRLSQALRHCAPYAFVAPSLDCSIKIVMSVGTLRRKDSATAAEARFCPGNRDGNVIFNSKSPPTLLIFTLQLL